MASGDVVLTVTGAVISLDDVDRSGNDAFQTTEFDAVTSTATTTPNGSLFDSARIVLVKNTGPSALVETPFDATKTYKITVTEV